MPVGDRDHENSRSVWPCRQLPAHRILVGPAILYVPVTDRAGSVDLPRQRLNRDGRLPAITWSCWHRSDRLVVRVAFLRIAFPALDPGDRKRDQAKLVGYLIDVAGHQHRYLGVGNELRQGL
jgi:hypothetical protein